MTNPPDDDVRQALERAARLGTFLVRRPAERRRAWPPVEDAARETTRRARIEALVRALPPT